MRGLGHCTDEGRIQPEAAYPAGLECIFIEHGLPMHIYKHPYIYIVLKTLILSIYLMSLLKGCEEVWKRYFVLDS